MKPRRKTVLVADEEEFVRELAVSYLEEAGYRVLVAKTGLEALKMVTEGRKRFHLLLTGLRMPELDGPGLIAALRKRGRRQPMVLWSFHCQFPREPTEPDKLPEELCGQFVGATLVALRRFTDFYAVNLVRSLIG